MPTNITPIRHIIFDFGGVFLNIDFSLTFQAFRKLSNKPFEEIFARGFDDPLLLDLETGKVSPEAFRDELRKRLEIGCSDELLDQAWNALLLDLPDHRVELARKVARNYRIFLLSNTNIIHYQKYNGEFRQRNGSNFDDLFEQAFWSHELGLRKPTTTCFDHVLKKSGIQPYNTVFIDDSRPNIDGALRAGLFAIHLKGDVNDLFDSKGNLITNQIESPD